MIRLFRNASPLRAPKSLISRFIFSSVVIIVVTAINAAMWSYLSPTYFLLWFPAVLITSLWGGFSVGMTTAIVGGLVMWWAFIPERFSWNISHGDAIKLAIYMVNSIAIAGVAHLLTEMKLRASLSQFDETIDRMGDGYLAIDQQGRMTYANLSALKILGEGLRQGLLKKWSSIRLTAGWDELQKKISDALRPDTFSEFQSQNYLTSQWVEVEAACNPNGATFFLRDISARKLAEQEKEERSREISAAYFELKKLNNELRRSNTELAHFAHAASHDMKEPLRMVSNYLQLLERTYRDSLDEEARLYIGFAVEGAQRLHLLIDDILNYSRLSLEPAASEPVDLNECLSTATANLQLLIRETKATIESNQLPVVFGQKQPLVQVFQNLISNSLKFRKLDTPPVIKVTSEMVDGRCMISVSDNGIGIAKESQQKIFELFHRLYPQSLYPGSGVGLSLCKRVVERLGGEMSVSSEENVGTTFKFSLPTVETPRSVAYQS